MITVQNISKSFGRVTALDDVSFEVPDGQITALLGANGSGKTTLMRIVCGLVNAKTGGAAIDHLDPARDPVEARKKIGWFPDQFGLYARLTAREHIVYFARFHGLMGKDLDARIDEMADLLDLKDILDRRTEGFSQGQRMKVALARTLVHRPQNLILDEPMRGLDIVNIRLLRSLLKRLRGENRCLMFSSHVMADVSELADRIIVLHQGHLVAEGTRSDICALGEAETLEDAYVNLTIEDAYKSLFTQDS